MLLKEFSSGQPLFLSVREARNQLELLEIRPDNPLPNASWLPIVCQNSSQPEIVLEPTAKSVSKQKVLILGAVVVLLGLLVGGIFWSRKNWSSNAPSDPVSSENPVSGGDKLILTSEVNEAKSQGIEAYAAQEWDTAIAAFRESLNTEKDQEGSLDPETWLYLNNAIAQKNAALSGAKVTRLAIAASIPEKAEEKREDPQGIAKELLRGVALRQAEFNCGIEDLVSAIENLSAELSCQGTQNQFIHFTIADDQGLNNESRAKAVAKTLAQEPIVAVVGHFFQ